MDIEELRQYQALKREIESLERLRDSLYFDVHSPSLSASYGTTPGNPTENTVRKIAHYDDLIDEKIVDLREMVVEIEEWLNTVSNPDIRAITRWHYLIGLTWKETARKMYSYENSDACRKQFYRYFGIELK